MTPSSDLEPFIVVAGDMHSEAPLTLAEPVPQPLGLLDQFGLWGKQFWSRTVVPLDHSFLAQGSSRCVDLRISARDEKFSLAARLRGKFLIDPYGSSDVPG